MPLSVSAVARTPRHRRSVCFDGFRRADGLWDIEGRLLDTKHHDYELSSGLRRIGEPVHELYLRVTIDDQFVVREIEACSDAVPYPGGCDTVAPAYRQLIGASLLKGFRRQVETLVGGVLGCSHLTELLLYVPTAAIQTFAGEVRDNDHGDAKPFQLDHCRALETSSETVRRYYPKWYRGAAGDAGREAETILDEGSVK
ncbi:MAG: DUF2889 domain-containing protein [Betaproteobacteria bacterium]|nr:DUF2889 domain-containing protein [Betaproteobacteria bacterium]